MTQTILILLLLAGSPASVVQATEANCPTAPVPGNYTPVLSKPPMNSIMEAGLKTRMRNVEGIVLLQHDSSGNVTHASLEKSSGNKHVDAAILKWANGVKMQPGTCGFSKVSAGFSMSS